MSKHDLTPGGDAGPCPDRVKQICAYFEGTLAFMDEMDLMRHLEDCVRCGEYFEEKAALILGFHPDMMRESDSEPND